MSIIELVSSCIFSFFRFVLGYQIKSKDQSSSHQRCSAKKVFLEISQNSQETPAAESLF